MNANFVEVNKIFVELTLFNFTDLKVNQIKNRIELNLLLKCIQMY